MHLPGMNLAGPGTRLDLRLNPNGTPKENSKPVDRVDEAAYRHDMAYSAFPDTKMRNVADRVMVSELNEIPNPTIRERVERAVIKPILSTKANFGLGLSKKSKNLKWTDELADELHKPVTKHFRKRRVEVRGVDKIWAADLVDMQAFSEYNNGFKYLLCVIDNFSKYGWIVMLKDKSGKSVAHAFEKIFSLGRKPEKLWVDKGKEFYNKDVKALGIELGFELYSTENEEKSCVVERWNRTMKEKMFKYF
jgi:Phospholipase A2-like domain